VLKVFAVIGMVATGCLAAGMGKVVVGSWWPDAPAKTSEAQAALAEPDRVSDREELMRGIMWIRATLPRKIDDHTTLVAVGLEGKTYWSRMVLDADAGDISDSAKAAVVREVTEDVCRRSGLRTAMHGNTIAVYHVDYVDRGRHPIQSIEITKNDCR
jgi:hypothetical protein